MLQFREFLFFLKNYFQSRLLNFGKRFESLKNLLVAILIVKRGKYSSSFLNTSFLFLILTAVVAGPIIAENNPFISSLEQNLGKYQASVVSYNPYESSLGTIISAKPRDKVVDYTVREGDTLDSIAKKFGVSVDSIRWASNLKTTTIKPNETLQIPPVSGIVYKVTAGDNVYTIAKKFSTDAQKIVNFPFNDFVDSNSFTLTIGQTLIVPDGIPPQEKPAVAPQYAQVQEGVRGSSNFIWPTTGSISQYPIWYHMAVDIQNPGAPAITAADTGTVVFAGCLGYGYGCHVIVDHANGYETLYGHMSQISVNAGEAVSQGQQLGVMGCTGRCTGTHLHFEVRSGGTQLNPLSFLK